MAYGASLESWLGASPRGFESPILRGGESRPKLVGTVEKPPSNRGHFSHCPSSRMVTLLTNLEPSAANGLCITDGGRFSRLVTRVKQISCLIMAFANFSYIKL